MSWEGHAGPPCPGAGRGPHGCGKAARRRAAGDHGRRGHDHHSCKQRFFGFLPPSCRVPAGCLDCAGRDLLDRTPCGTEPPDAGVGRRDRRVQTPNSHSAMTFPALVRVNFDRLCQATVTLQRASDAVPALPVSPGHRRCATLRESGDAGPIRQRQLVPALCILGRLDGLPARRAWWPMMITCCAPTRSVGSVTGIRRRCRRIRQLFPAAGDGRTTRLAPTTRSGCRCDNRAAGVRSPGAVAATPRFLDVRGRPAKGRRFSYRHTNRRKNAI